MKAKSKRASPVPVPAPTKPAEGTARSVLQISGDPIEREKVLARLGAEGLFTNGVVMTSFSSRLIGDVGIVETMGALRESVAKVHGGDLEPLETVLLGQALALNAMFAELSRRSGANMGEHLDAADRYMRLALKAQGQCRATLETLAVIKNPPVFARQANINHGGQQQVNNGTAAPAAPAPAAQPHSQPNRLLETGDGQRLDTRAQGAAGTTDPHMETVGARHRTKDAGRKGRRVA